MSLSKPRCIAVLTILLTLLLFGHRQANAIGFTWVAGDGDWHIAPFWAPFAPPLMGPPGLGDAATIAGDRDVTLTANALGLTGMLVQAQADIFTNNNQLTVVDINGNAAATVVGVGTTGNNTELFVTPVGGTTPGFIADNLNLMAGGELDLMSGGITHITNRLEVDELSIITGDGTIVFADTHNVTGDRINLHGTIRPDTNSAIQLIAESGTLNVDGVNAAMGLGFLDLGNSGSSIWINGELTDAFSGRLEMGSGTSLFVNTPWTLGADNAGSLGAEIHAGNGQATISGGELTVGGIGASVDVVSGALFVLADSRFQSAASIDVEGGARLGVGGASSIITGGSWTGTGSVNLDATVTTIAADTTVDMPGGTFDIDGNLIGGQIVAINQTLTLNVHSVDNTVTNEISDTTQINGAAGQLNVNLTNPNLGYTFAGTLELNGPGGGLTGIHLAGSRVELAGTTSVSGSSTSQARVHMSGGMNIALGGSFNLLGGSLAFPNRIESTATFGGSGSLNVLSSGYLRIDDGAAVNVNVENRGRIALGVSTAEVSLGRDFTQTSLGTLAMEIGGPPVGGHDVLAVGNDAMIDGELEVTVINAFVPTIGQNYTLLTADSVSGTFDSLTLLSDSLFEYEAALFYPGTRVVLQFTDVTMFGDFDDDLTLDCADVDALVAEIASSGMGLEFDLTGDGLVTVDDLSEWLDVAGTYNVGGPYLTGDANLDGVVDGQDFIEWNAHKFTMTAAWCSGDFNADGVVDGADFIEWNGNKFMESDAVSSVPEPGMAGCWLVITLMRRVGAKRRPLW